MSSLAYSFSAHLLLKRISTPLRILSPFPSWTRCFSVESPPAEHAIPVASESDVPGEAVTYPGTDFGKESVSQHFNPKDPKEEILYDVQPLILLVREIIHSDRYADGEPLSAEHEKFILKKILPHHPDAEDKIGCGVDYITVDHHPDFKHSRCLFVVRTDGTGIDFSYNVCIGAYVRRKYSSDADTFIKKHLKNAGWMVGSKVSMGNTANKN